MNLANKLTVLRMVLVIPFILLLVIANKFPSFVGIGKFFEILALIIFIFAAITDYYDGKIARENNMVTDFGKLFDPLADKLLCFSGFAYLLLSKKMGLIFFMILLAREFYVLGIRAFVASKSSEVIAATNLAKLKTVFTYVVIVYAILIPSKPFINVIKFILYLILIVLNILSVTDYHNKAFEIIKNMEE